MATMTAADLQARYAAGERNFRFADLAGASLRGADLAGADLEPIKQDVQSLCRLMPAEVPGLLAALGRLRAGDSNALAGDVAS